MPICSQFPHLAVADLRFTRWRSHFADLRNNSDLPAGVAALMAKKSSDDHARQAAIAKELSTMVVDPEPGWKLIFQLSPSPSFRHRWLSGASE